MFKKIRESSLIPNLTTVFFTLVSSLANLGLAHELKTIPDKKIRADFDVVKTQVTTESNQLVFTMAVSGRAGKSKPSKIGKLGGSRVFSYVWPTSLDPIEVGFEGKSGILAFAVTSHPDFDDTPLFDENGNGKTNDDGNLWHSHWVVLVPDEACGPKGMKVKDIAPGTKPKMLKTWPGLPIFIDSPGYSPILSQSSIEVRVPLDNISIASEGKFDGVTAGLRVNESVHSPLLCIENVFKVASGDLSLPGKMGP